MLHVYLCILFITQICYNTYINQPSKFGRTQGKCFHDKLGFFVRSLINHRMANRMVIYMEP